MTIDIIVSKIHSRLERQTRENTVLRGEGQERAHLGRLHRGRGTHLLYLAVKAVSPHAASSGVGLMRRRNGQPFLPKVGKESEPEGGVAPEASEWRSLLRALTLLQDGPP